MLTIDAQTGYKYYYEHRANFSLQQASTDYENTYERPRNIVSAALVPSAVAVAGHELAKQFGLSDKLRGWV